LRERRVTGSTQPTLDVLLAADELRSSLERDVREGFRREPKTLPAKWHYDAEGSRLFDEITRLPEYYLTRTERAILEQRAAEIVGAAEADTLVELGAGTSEKTRLLLDAMAAGERLRRIVLLDVDEATLRASVERLAADYPAAEVHGVVGDVERHFGALPHDGDRLVVYLGSSIGNFGPGQRARLLREVASSLDEGESLLLGVDLVKSPRRLEAAYDDSAGVTARFSGNVLARLNRDLGADFDVSRFRHVATWDPRREWVDIRLRSLTRQEVTIDALGMTVEFDEGEELHTEISAKFRREGIERELLEAGLTVAGWWADPASDFGLSLARRRAARP
jgi:L-histidine Nalpha-methyltransferase